MATPILEVVHLQRLLANLAREFYDQNGGSDREFQDEDIILLYQLEKVRLYCALAGSDLCSTLKGQRHAGLLSPKPSSIRFLRGLLLTDLQDWRPGAMRKP